MEYKVTRKLFRNKYKYKIVLVCAGSQWFRSGDLDLIYEHLTRFIPTVNGEDTARHAWLTKIKSKEDLDFCFKLHKQLCKMSDFDLRVESPWLSIYTNEKADIDSLKKIEPAQVKYISKPAKNIVLEQGVVIMSKTPYEFKVTLGKTCQNFSAFVDWAEIHPKVKMTKSCKKDLLQEKAWGGTHFYVTGEKNLLLAKMHLGGSINKIERIVKSDQ
jgi:hypothetical protein